MSNIGKRVRLANWPYDSKLKEGTYGSITSESARSIGVLWDGFMYARGMMPEEIELLNY